MEPIPQQILKFAFSLLIFLSFENSFSQTLKQDSVSGLSDTTRTAITKKKPDSLKIKFYPRGIRFGTDIVAIIKSSVVPNYYGWEVNADIDFGKFYFSVDYGFGGRTDKLALDGMYKNQGSYWRAGWDANILLKDPDKNMLYFGFRYCRSYFKESAFLSISDSIYGDFTQSLNNDKVRARWFELVAGLKVKVWSHLWIGYTCRLKIAPKASGYGELKSYDIPGFGLFAKTFYWGFNYQIFWQIPFPKKNKLKPKT